MLGMGNMGRAFATRALGHGHQVTVWNRTPGRASGPVAAGAVEAPSPAEAASGAQVVLVVLSDDAAVLEVCLGGGGVLAALPDGAVLACVSTVSPETVRRLGDAGGHTVLDTPVVGSPEMIADGHGRFLAGGSREAVDALAPLWADLSAGATYCGDLGSGEALKLVVNMLLITGVSALAEAVATARGAGLPDDLLREVLGQSPVVSPASLVRLGSVLDPGHPGWFTPELAAKDLQLARELAARSGLEARMGPAAGTLLDAVIRRGRAWEDFAAVIEAFD